MAITKTKFINYTRCPYYYHLDNSNKEKLLSKVSLKEYLDEEYKYDNEVTDEQLEVMLPYYKKCEELAISLAPKYFTGTFIGSQNTLEQECFECKINGILYCCYVDIYNETQDGNINIIEVKSTTIDKFLKTNYFGLDDRIYKLKDIEKANTKLLNKYDECGKYIYDISVQRYIIEKDLKKNGLDYLIPNIKYHLAVLNNNYIFNGEYKDNEPVYNTDKNGNDIINFIDVTDITKLYLPIINKEREELEKVINNNFNQIRVGSYCQYKKAKECPYTHICFKNLPEHNSVFSYIDNHFGFNGDKKYSTYDLINNNLYSMLDIPDNYLTREKNIIQKNVVKNNEKYINLEKIRAGLKLIKYPIYHLDFETFPCPLPRFKGERCYTQSVFQFSLHIETIDGCDKDLNHYGYLAKTNNDEREELVKSLCSLIDKEGTVLVYNSSFEKNRLKELAVIFPQYKEKLDFINNMVFDLLNIVKTNKKMFMKLGFSEKESSIFNYYHPDLDGSFSIKKVLPLFSNLNYKDLNISNGVEALVTYSKFDKMEEEEYIEAYNSLVEYCKQDTWAMVEILHGLYNLSKNVKL